LWPLVAKKKPVFITLEQKSFGDTVAKLKWLSNQSFSNRIQAMAQDQLQLVVSNLIHDLLFHQPENISPASALDLATLVIRNLLKCVLVISTQGKLDLSDLPSKPRRSKVLSVGTQSFPVLPGLRPKIR